MRVTVSGTRARLGVALAGLLLVAAVEGCRASTSDAADGDSAGNAAGIAPRELPAPGSPQSRPRPTPLAFDADAVVDQWVQLWRTYDLDRLGALFLQDDRVTYFSSEREGLIRGADALREHHRGFGFVAGGTQPAQELWVEDVHATRLADTVVVAAVWYFGDRAAPQEAGRGPMTIVYVRDHERFRIAHMHFGNYPAPDGLLASAR